MAAPSAPIPVPPSSENPTELLRLIEERKWPAVIERCRTDPHEAGSAPRLRNERGYPALHALVAYNQSVAGEELVPPIRAVLDAADDIDYAAEYRLGGNDDEKVEDENKVNTNEIVEGEDAAGAKRMAGSWRLLLDQENKARWSPLHLTCVHGGITHGKTAVIKALLRMDENETAGEEVQKHQRRALALLDRQDRNLLHHLLSGLVPSNQSYDDVRFLLAASPSLLFQKDSLGKTPMAYVAERLAETPGTRRRHYMESYGRDDDEGERKNHEMLRVLVAAMERETSGWGHVMAEEERLEVVAPAGKLGVVLFTPEPPAPMGPALVSEVKEDSPLEGELRVGDRVVAVDDEDASEMTSTEVSALLARKGEHPERKIAVLREVGGGGDDPAAASEDKNVLQRACLLPRDLCPADGALLTYLASERASRLEAKARGDGNDVNMAAEADGGDNRALHLFAANRSYVNDEGAESSHEETPARRRRRDAAEGNNGPRYNAEYKAMRALLDIDPEAASLRNNSGHTPLNIAMKCGRRQGVALLVLENPKAVILDEATEDNKLFMHALACTAVPRFCTMGREGAGVKSNYYDDDEEARFHRRCLTTAFDLVRARPDVVALAGGGGAAPKAKGDRGDAPPKKRWWRKLNPF